MADQAVANVPQPQGGPDVQITINDPQGLARPTIVWFRDTVSFFCFWISIMFYVLASWRFVHLHVIEDLDSGALSWTISVVLHGFIQVGVFESKLMVDDLKEKNRENLLTAIKFVLAWGFNLVAAYGALHFVTTCLSVDYLGCVGGAILFQLANLETTEDFSVLDVITAWALTVHVVIHDTRFYWSAVVSLINSLRIVFSALFSAFREQEEDDEEHQRNLD